MKILKIFFRIVRAPLKTPYAPDNTDPQGGKTYKLKNRVITAVMQKKSKTPPKYSCYTRSHFPFWKERNIKGKYLHMGWPWPYPFQP
jgi:hypothetical protein